MPPDTFPAPKPPAVAPLAAAPVAAVPAAAPPYRPPPDEGLVLVHADAALLVLDKPAGLLSVPGRGAGKADCLAARAQARFPEARVVHRLDQATSGLLLMALGPEVQSCLSQAFRERRVHKRYVAVVAGRLGAPGDTGQIDLPLSVDWPRRPRQRVDHEQGKPSLTRWRVLAHDAVAGTTRVELEPVTGRSHQLRVHLLAIGHPIVGDDLYGPQAGVAPPPARLLLHACELALDHPATGRRERWCSAAPF